MERVNGKDKPPTPSEWLMQNLAAFEKEHGRRPFVIMMSSDVMRDLYKEMKSLGTLPKESKPFSIALILRDAIQFTGVEVALIGGSKRFALL